MTLIDADFHGTRILSDRDRVAEDWLAAARQPKTAATYGRAIRAWFSWCDRRGVDALRPHRSDVDRYRQHLARGGDENATQGRKLATLSSFYRYGYLFHGELVPANPVDGVNRPRVSKESTRASLDLAEVRRVLAVAEQSGPWDHALVAVLAHTGLRVAELCTATVAGMRVEHGYRTLTVTRKGGKRGRVTLPPPVPAAVDRMLDGRGEGPLFTGSRGGPVSRYDVATALARLVRAAGVDKPITPHSMRHTAATLAREAGADARAIQEMLGHATIETTMRYLAARDQVERSPAHALARLIGDLRGVATQV